jgi:hypothetical protein
MKKLFLLSALLLGATDVLAQDRDLTAENFILRADNGYGLTLSAPIGLASNGTFTFPMPGTGTGEITMMGNTFNGANQLVQLSPTGSLILANGALLDGAAISLGDFGASSIMVGDGSGDVITVNGSTISLGGVSAANINIGDGSNDLISMVGSNVNLATNGDLSLSAAGSSLLSPRTLSWSNIPLNGAVSINFFDNSHFLRAGMHQQTQLVSYHTLQIWGKNAASIPAWALGTASNNALEVYATATSHTPLAIKAGASQTAHLQTWEKGASMVALLNSEGDLLARSFVSNYNLGDATVPAEGGYYADNTIMAWGNVAAGGSLTSSFGGLTPNHPATGTYHITLPSIPSAAVITITPQLGMRFASAQLVGDTFQITITDDAGVATDTPFYFIVTGRP